MNMNRRPVRNSNVKTDILNLKMSRTEPLALSTCQLRVSAADHAARRSGQRWRDVGSPEAVLWDGQHLLLDVQHNAAPRKYV